MRCSINWVACFDEIAPCVIFHVVCKSVSVRSLHRMARMALRMARGRAVCRESVGRAEQSNPKPQRKRSKEEVAKAMVRPSPSAKEERQARSGQGRTPRQILTFPFGISALARSRRGASGFFPAGESRDLCEVKSSLYINNRQPYGSLST